MPANYLSRFRALSRNARLYVLSNTIQAVSAGAISVLYTLFLASLGYGPGFTGIVIAVSAAGGALGILPAGPLVDRLGWRTMLIWSDMIGGVAILVQLLAPTPAVLLITGVGVGASVAIVLVINTPLLAANSTPVERTALFGLTNALSFLALVVGSLLGGVLPVWFAQPAVRDSGLLLALRPLLLANATARGYQLALLVTGVLAVPSLIPVFLLRHEPRPAAAAPQPALVVPVALRARAARAMRQGRTLLHGAIGRFSMSQLFIGLGAGIFYPFTNLYFVNLLHGSTAYYGVLSAALTVLLAVVSLLSAPLADHFGKLRTVIVSQVSSLPFLAALALAPPLVVASALYLLRGSLMNLALSPLQAFYMEAVPEEDHGLASEVYNGSWQAFWALGAPVGGVLASIGGYGLPFLGAAVSYTIGILLLIRWFAARRRPRQVSLPQPRDAAPAAPR